MINVFAAYFNNMRCAKSITEAKIKLKYDICLTFLVFCSNVNYTSDGKNILFILKQKEMEQMLGGFQG